MLWTTLNRCRSWARSQGRPQARSAARGFSIVEALIALAILSVGMLGIAALYIESLRASRSALYRTRAVTLTTDMADRIRANRNAGVSGEVYALKAGDKPAQQNCTGNGKANCTRAALAQEDLANWLAAIRSTLPGDGGSTPSGTITVDTGGVPTRYTITVTWSEPGEPQPLSYVLNLQL